MDIHEAIAYVNAHLVEIGGTARYQNRAALLVKAAYAQLSQRRNKESEDTLIQAVAQYQVYRQENPLAEI